MPSINMIAVRREQKRRQEQNIRKLLYSILGEAGLFVAVTFVMMARILVTQSHINSLSDQLNKLQPQVTKIQDLQAQTASLQPKVQTLEGAKADTLFWYKNFYAVTDSLPQQAWLTSLGTGSAAPTVTTPGTAAGDDPTLAMTGIAMTQAAVGATMLRMNQSPLLDHVDLAFVQQQKIGKMDTVSFQMTVHLKPEDGTQGPGTTSGTAKGADNGTKS